MGRKKDGGWVWLKGRVSATEINEINRMLSLFYCLKCERQDAAKLIQKVWEQVLKTRPNQPVRSPRAYLFAIARRVLYRHYERKLGKGWDPAKWFGHVERAMLLLAEPRWYRRARYGYSMRVASDNKAPPGVIALTWIEGKDGAEGDGGGR